jgi:cytochrome P450
MSIAFDPADKTFRTDPYPLLAELRAKAPVHFSPALKGWTVFRHADVQRVMRDSQMSADKITPFYTSLNPQQRSEVQVLIEYLGRWLVFRDPPDHTRLRGLIARAFTPKSLASIRSNIDSIVTMLLDDMAGKTDVDLVTAFSNPLPAFVIMDMLGVPRAMLGEMKSWSDDIKLFIGTAKQTEDKYARARRGVEGMGDAFRVLIKQRRTAPTDDVLSMLVAVNDSHDGRLSDEELIATSILFLFAGHETTASLIAMASIALMRDEAARAQFLGLRSPLEVQTAVEEFLRFDGPTPSMMRIALVGAEIDGHAIKPGDRVWTFIGAANRDPHVFDRPDQLNLGRAPNPHVTFGFGTHFCLGAPLARLEAQIALPRLHARYPQMMLAATPSGWNDGLTLRGPGSVPVRLGALASSG